MINFYKCEFGENNAAIRNECGFKFAEMRDNKCSNKGSNLFLTFCLIKVYSSKLSIRKQILNQG